MVLKLENTIQPYAWGSTSSIPDLFGIANRDGAPMAEIWMGAHPKAPSRFQTPGGSNDLAALIREDPEGTLGLAVAHRFAGSLPFLFKILAAAEPLSIQAHPSERQAQLGFERENQAGVPIVADHRNYRDPNHKPELIYALTPFWGLRGFREPAEIRSLLEPVVLLAGSPGSNLILPHTESDLAGFFESLMKLDQDSRDRLIDAACKIAEEHWPDTDLRPNPGDLWSESFWVLELSRKYPGDPGVLAPLFLNVFSLVPGQATYQPAGVLHAYLHGTGAEVMANSDNVLRGGLTPKHIDLPELLRVGLFRPEPAVILSGTSRGATTTFETPFDEFEFSVLNLDGNQTLEGGAPSILFCAAGVARLGDGLLVLGPGESAFVRADTPDLRLEGEATILCATTPQAP